MKFCEILPHLLKGGKSRQKQWPVDTYVSFFSRDGDNMIYLQFFRPGKYPVSEYLCHGDFTTDDWEIKMESTNEGIDSLTKKKKNMCFFHTTPKEDCNLCDGYGNPR